MHRTAIVIRTAPALILAAAALLAPSSGAAQAAAGTLANAAPQPRRIAMPPPEALIVLIRSTVVALAQANATNNYTVLRQLGSRTFQAQNSAAQLAATYAPFRARAIDLSPVVFVTPELTASPRIGNARLRVIGVFPSPSARVAFDLSFEPEGGMWKLAAMAVNLAGAPTIR